MPRRVIHFQKTIETCALWNCLPAQVADPHYHLVSIDRTHLNSSLHEDAETLLAIMNELDWSDAILIAHGADCRLLSHLVQLVPERISALFLVDAPDDVRFPEHLKTAFHVASSASQPHTPFEVPQPDWLLEVFHAFCTLRLQSA